jgi:hypothetical protein
MPSSVGQRGTVYERMDRKIKKTDTCWLWTGALNTSGRGILRVNYKTVQAHRLSYERYKGSVPPGMCVCHTCDVGNCVNPEHLWLGSHQDNMSDMAKKGRSTKGISFIKRKRK